MAKGTAVDVSQRRSNEPFSVKVPPTRQRATLRDQSECEVFDLVQNTDYTPPKQKLRDGRSSEDTPLKTRIALGYLRVNGHEEPIYTPIQGFEHLFNQEDVVAPWPSPQREAPESGTSRFPSSTDAATQPRGVKRRRPRRGQDEDEGHYADEEPEATVVVEAAESFSVGDIHALMAFYAVRFQELTMKPLRDIVTAWVKRLEPRRQQQYGPYMRYNNYKSDNRGEKPKSIKPPWWPAEVPYVEPSHLKLRHLVPLAVDIMLVHRRIDESCGKRRYASWITELERDAQYHVTSKNTEHFSSSKGAKYNEAMKKRALDVILPSLFDIAKSHEDYVAQFDLYEGSGNEDPGYGKQVSWQPAPKPDRMYAWKRPRHSPKSGRTPEDDNGDETEVDEETDRPSSSISSFQSTFSYTEDVKMFPEPAFESPPAADMMSIPPLQASAPPTSSFDQSMDYLCLSDVDVSPTHYHVADNPARGVMNPPLAGFPQPFAYMHPLNAVQIPFSVDGSPPLGFPGSVGQDLPTYGVASNSLPVLAHDTLPAHGIPVHSLPPISPSQVGAF